MAVYNPTEARCIMSSNSILSIRHNSSIWLRIQQHSHSLWALMSSWHACRISHQTQMAMMTMTSPRHRWLTTQRRIFYQGIEWDDYSSIHLLVMRQK